MTGESLGPRTGSNGFLQQLQNGATSQIHTGPALVRRPSKTLLHSREKERPCPFLCRLLGRRKVAVLLMVALALFVFVFGSFTSEKGADIIREIQDSQYYALSRYEIPNPPEVEEKRQAINYSSGSFSPGTRKTTVRPPSPPSSHSTDRMGQFPTMGHPCDHFAIPPPPPSDRRRPGPRPCPVCYVPVEQAIASMPIFPSASPVLRTLTYVHDENPVKIESHDGSEFGGYPSLEDRDAAFDVKEAMTVHCGFVKGGRPGHHTGFDIDEDDISMLDEYHDIIVASGIFGNYDVIQQPKNISKEAKKHIPFYMFIDEETEMYMKNASILGSSKRVGLWRIIVIRNLPYADSRRNGKIPKLLLHRIFPNVRYSIWIDGKLQLVADPYQVLERFLWRSNSTFSISRHYRRFDVFVEAEANKAAGKYENASIDQQIQFYQNHDGLTHYSKDKLPITSDVPEGCVLIKEHIPITDLFTCLWFNEVDRFTSRDQLSFSTVRDKIMAKVDWRINMFMDCERRNFVIQTYHREILEHMPPPAPPIRRPPPRQLPPRRPLTPPHTKKSPKRTRGDRRSSSKRHRKFRLLQLTWSARNSTDGTQDSLWIAEKEAVYATLPLFAFGFLIELVKGKNNSSSSNNHDLVAVSSSYLKASSWEVLKSYGGLVNDGFLLPQIMMNMFSNMKENALCGPFYLGTSFLRLLPHVYDLYRSSQYDRQYSGSYLYADPSADFYSTAWDLAIIVGCLLFALAIYLQQRFGGSFILPFRFSVSETYEMVPIVTQEA